jgi:phosphoribosyl 1,2-cyclic phosphate phosphodiesterase
MKNRFILLGTGGSMGIPVLGCHCERCTSTNPKNTRTRSSALIEYDNKKYIIDSGPDFRQNALNYRIERIEGLIITHHHHDHTGGLDELRAYNIWSQQPIPCLLSAETLKDLETRFYYIFTKRTEANFVASFDLQILPKERGELTFAGLPLKYFTYSQMDIPVNGFRFGDLAYVSDINMYPDTIFEDLKGLKTLIVSALRYTPSKMHFTVDEAVAFAQKVGAEKTWFTHIAHEIDHVKTNAYLPKGIELAYDGMEIEFSYAG